ncbi:hypothetical protein MFLAVUS_007686 [Mucor flavus]|uniref:LRR containing protein n=1 Tax=Mucor flavus TaxID=439312 RepID=A0ABP9Z514_9FUNG
MSDDYVNIWKLIRYERMNGNFRMLEAIPSNEYQTDVNSYIYQSVAFCLQETLREIIIYDKNVPLDQAYVWKFPKMKTVFFEFNDYIDPGSINRNMETFPSATDIEIDVENPEESQVQVSTGFHRPVFRYVTKLSIRGRYHNTGISSYIMESFPRLQEITIFAASTSSRQLALSTEEAVRFLDYLVCVQKFNVSSIPISDQYGVMLGFYGGNRYTDKLKVRYESNSFISGSQRLNFETDSQVEGLIQIGIFHEHGIIPFLPRIGLIERSGGNLQFLELDMGMSAVTDMVAALPNKHKGVNLSTILRQCPQLRDIYILNTGLEEFGEDLQFENGKVINGHLSFTNSIFHTSFLPGLSFRVHYISHLTLKNCLFWNIPSCEMMREIDLRNTELRTITCEYMLSVEKINLKLIKTQTNVTQWCLIQHNRVFLSSEQDFNYSVQTQNNLSLTICCRNIFSVNFIINGHNATFNP